MLARQRVLRQRLWRTSVSVAARQCARSRVARQCGRERWLARCRDSALITLITPPLIDTALRFATPLARCYAGAHAATTRRCARAMRECVIVQNPPREANEMRRHGEYRKDTRAEPRGMRVARCRRDSKRRDA